MGNRTTVMLDDNGFTLIEFLVAIVILMVGLLGLLQAVNVSLNHNLQNQLRTEGVVVADEEMAREMAKGYDLVSTSTKSYVISKRPVLNAFKNFSVTRSGTILQNSKQVSIAVSWHHRGVSYNHGAAAVITKTNQ
ncbi:prepilin-type N-terminal cleavage/methylation domain-containing protein [Oryzomonas japonica]|uniref:Prepilin-type N-terminal cleavage/methylation domain-containing protein n=2 Tax=Oryzomonas japonica TaxID=2603858 RepID=A0A7J4ZQ54_9BACT|nr:prepilin-type N-terminal cleavage/methylation domain-containing protein [Oryzomonas japonica]